MKKMFVSEENVRAVNTETQCVSNLQSVAVFLAVADMDSSCRLLWELVGITPIGCEGFVKANSSSLVLALLTELGTI